MKITQEKMRKEILGFMKYLIMTNHAVVNGKTEVMDIQTINSNIDYYLTEIKGKY